MNEKDNLMNTFSNENNDLQRRVEAELLPGEELLWVGQGDGRLNARRMSGAPIRAVLVLLVAGLVMVSIFGGLFMTRGMVTTGFGSFSRRSASSALWRSCCCWSCSESPACSPRPSGMRRATYAITNRRIMI
jgi:hypothetical protein